MRRRGTRGFRVDVSDISLDGCRAQFVERPGLNEMVSIRFDGLEAMPAVVCWVRGFDVGLEFDRPIHPAVFEMLVARLKGE